MELSLVNILLAFGITTAGALLQGSIGFGLGPMSVPLLVLIDPRFIPGPLLLSALLLTLLLAYREHQAIHLKGLMWAVPGRIVGSVIGALVLTVIPQKNLSLMFGTMVILAILIFLTGVELPLIPRNIFAAGTISGLMGTTSAIGGAPMALVYQKQEGPRIRGTLSGIFVFGTIISLISLAVIHRFGLAEMRRSLVLIPGVLLGFYLSKYTVKTLDKGLVRPTVLAVSAISGLIVIFKRFF